MLVGPPNTIHTKNTPYCIVANSDESQLVLHACNSDWLETYSFKTNKISFSNFPGGTNTQVIA